VAAVISRADQLLVVTVGALDYWFLPGGRIQFGEPSHAALTRELAEELGHDLPGGGEPGHTFRWVPFRELGDLDFRPAGLVTMLPGLDDTVRHVVLDRLDRSPA
jgi:8-oxo-dGTP pyrophosphatase MutT (NUDIX family)